MYGVETDINSRDAKETLGFFNARGSTYQPTPAEFATAEGCPWYSPPRIYAFGWQRARFNLFETVTTGSATNLVDCYGGRIVSTSDTSAVPLRATSVVEFSGCSGAGFDGVVVQQFKVLMP